MEITLDPALDAALRESARRRGLAPEALVVDTLRERFLAPPAPVVPRDEWERRLLAAASDCGVSLPPEALTSDGMYE
jgi:hypothetical protein